MDTKPAEIVFAQKLASNEKKIRDKALKKLRRWLKAKSSSKKGTFTMEDYLSLWKGLHYCMWMQDKMLLQEELSTNLSKLVHEISGEEAQLLFIRVFFMTEAREWNNIDRWRLDKFMMLVRNVLHEALTVLKMKKWQKTLTDKFCAVLSDTVMRLESGQVTEGLKIHLADIYLDELEKVGGVKLSGQQVLAFLQPFVTFLQKGENFDVVKRIISRVFEPIIDRCVEDALKGENSEEVSDKKPDPELYPEYTLQFDYTAIADCLFEMSKSRSCHSKNRAAVYKLVKSLRDVQEGVIPKEEEVDLQPALTKQEVEIAANRLSKFLKGKAGDMKKTKKQLKKEAKKKQAEKAQADGKENIASGKSSVEQDDTTTGDETKKRKRKTAAKSEQEESPPKKQKVDANSEKKAKKEKKVKTGKRGKKANLLDELEQTDTQTNDSINVEWVKDSNTSQKGSLKEDETERTGFTNLKKKKNSYDLSNGSAQKLLTLAEEENSVRKKKKLKKEKKSKSKQKQWTVTESSVIMTTDEHEGENELVALPSVTMAAVDSESSVKSVENKSQKQTDASGESQVVSREVTSTDVAKRTVPDTDIQDGEIEIWVPNKKYTGKHKSAAASTMVGASDGPKFASFEKTAVPNALVRRGSAKLKTPKATPKTPSGASTPAGGSDSRSKKRVSFNMTQNMTTDVKERAQVNTEFNPARQPEQGILKTPQSAPTLRRHGNSKKQLTTPVTSYGSARKLTSSKKIKAPIKRLKLKSDFYL